MLTMLIKYALYQGLIMKADGQGKHIPGIIHGIVEDGATEVVLKPPSF